MTIAQKFAAAVLLFLAWGALVVLERTPVEPFVAALRDMLLALGIFQATLTNPKDQP